MFKYFSKNLPFLSEDFIFEKKLTKGFNMNIYYVILSVRNYRMHVNVYAINAATAEGIASMYIADKYSEDLRDIDVINCVLKKAA